MRIDLNTVQQQKGRRGMIDGNQELNNYVLKAPGLGRKGLNIMYVLGVFACMWLSPVVVFHMLGKNKLGWFYPIITVIPMGFCLAFSEVGISGIPLATASILAILMYVTGWVHANIVLSRYQANARERIAQIDRLPGGQLAIDAILEKGVLQSKVLADGEAAATLCKALELPGGDAQLLNLAGVGLFASKRYAAAHQFFARALSIARDDALIKQIKRNLAFVHKKFRSNRGLSNQGN
jgi:hypothetical protein